ncbi:hypothetical protein J3U08_09550 [Gilliamella sp. B2894]|uniref:hypothetical protein n=1 Tax=unclassified Gilliamella TaxID=2685620 RepID=UPI002269E91D|nr:MULTISPECIES: hypothetical protein [unclassified Gilliamella]MCX8657035.1 hypothetical protein [Gilliamella sp. B2894]MCX8692872.1 hypothetical protein [Gilliamella sp. B2881]MCX8696958.1 hypothetical protein [Gilliamella sp. B2828]
MSKEKVMNPSIRLYRNFIFPRLLKRITFFFMMLFSWVNESSAILSAQTVNKIIGNAPEIRQTADEKVLNGIQFKLKIDGLDPAIISPGTANKISVAYNTSPSLYSFGIDTSSLNDSDIYDVDGDKIANVDSFIIQSINAEWRDQNDNIIPSDSTASLGSDVCNSSTVKANLSVKLTIQFIAKTQYGDPDTSQPKEVSKTFQVSADDGICYIRPGVLALITNNGWNEGDNYAPYGADTISVDPPYNSDQFTIHKGFIATAKDQNGNYFPTYAFPEARFRIVPVNPISDYSYTLVKNPNNSLVNTFRASNSDSKSEFKFTDNVPDQGDKFVILVTNNRTLAQFYYTFSIKHWLYFLNNPIGNWQDSNKLCKKNNDRLPTRAEITNSPLAYIPTTNDNYYVKGNGYRRAIGEGLTAEWGKTYFYAPLDIIGRDMLSGVLNLKNFIYYEFYFTNEVSSMKDVLGNYKYYSVGIVEGNVIVEPDVAYTMCTKY